MGIARNALTVRKEFNVPARRFAQPGVLGIDISDGTLARQLSEEIWEREGKVLVVAAFAMRSQRS